MSHIPGKFTWFEHMSNDPPKARIFYEALFGWKVKTVPMEGASYDMIHLGEQGIGGIYGAPGGVPNHWVSYLSVPDVDKSFQAALNAGARSIMVPRDFPPVGRGASFIDPTGASISLWRGAEGDRPDVDPTPVGDWIWDELLSSDVRKSLLFYEKVFGFSYEAMDMGPAGTYHIVKSPDGKARGGMMQAPHAEMPSMWVPYVRGASADATAARAEQLGARLLMPVDAVPQVGRLTTLSDPVGAFIAIIEPAPM